jgi:hypothetical protein
MGGGASRAPFTHAQIQSNEKKNANISSTSPEELKVESLLRWLVLEAKEKDFWKNQKAKVKTKKRKEHISEELFPLIRYNYLKLLIV